MRFAVTGGAGFIGSYLVKELIRQNHTPVIVDSLYRGNLENLSPFKVELHQVDIREYDKLKMALKDVDGVFHEAALTDVQESFINQKEYFDVNVTGTENVFKVAKEFNIKVVYASSSSVYGNPKTIPVRENAERKPINPYGNTKLEDEFLAEKYWEAGVSVIGLRYFNVYGKGQTGSYAGVITKFINNLKEEKSPVIFGEGRQLRDFVFVEDVAKANIAAMQNDIKKGFYNIGTGLATSINDLAKIMIELSGLKLEAIHKDPLDGDVQKSQADTTLAEKTLNWKYETELRDGLGRFFPL